MSVFSGNIVFFSCVNFKIINLILEVDNIGTDMTATKLWAVIFSLPFKQGEVWKNCDFPWKNTCILLLRCPKTRITSCLERLIRSQDWSKWSIRLWWGHSCTMYWINVKVPQLCIWTILWKEYVENILTVTGVILLVKKKASMSIQYW